MRYTSFDKAHTITKGADKNVQFTYDDGRARYKRSVTTGTGTNAVTSTTWYVVNVEIQNVTGGEQYTRSVEGHALVTSTRNDTSRTDISAFQSLRPYAISVFVSVIPMPAAFLYPCAPPQQYCNALATNAQIRQANRNIAAGELLKLGGAAVTMPGPDI
ncbi:MAG: hypothetical protein OXC05_11175 [Halieaceae bacterium]|nr:hypothetical protein [Halieaceae bacterium]